MEYSKTYTVKDEHIDVQQIVDGLFSSTCVQVGGGRPFLPEGLLAKLADAPVWDGEL